MPRLFRALVAVLPLVLQAPSFAAAKKENSANKEVVEQRLTRHFPITAYSLGRGPAGGGAVVELLKPGLEAAPAGPIVPAFSYKNGQLRKLAATALLTQLLPLPPGSRFFVTKIEARENHVVFDVVTVEPLNGVWFRSAIHFDFGKGFLDAPDFTRIELTVAEVFGVERGGNNNAAPQYPPQQQPRQAPVSEPPPPPPPPAEPPPPPPPPAVAETPAAAPVEIKLGMTGDQVRAAMGKPAQVVKLGAKEIFVYKDIKVTLVNGKVTSID